MDIKKQILKLQEVSQTLEPSPSTRKHQLEKVSEFVNKFISELPKTPAYSPEKENRKRLQLSNSSQSIEELIKIYKEEVSAKGINPASGGHLGYIPGGGIYTSALADLMAAVTNDYVGRYYSSPGGVAIEHEILNWLKKIFNFPSSSVGNLTSGGSIANLIALTAARDKHGIKNEKIPKSVIYLSPQVHHCIQKALRIIGLEDVIINYINLDTRFRIDTSDLEKKIKNDKENGLNPYLVIASAGTTDTGAIDPLTEIGNIVKKYNLWYHIDAAYGGFFILVENLKKSSRGLKWQIHWLLIPIKACSCPMV
ncbi:MAG: aminotransferase class I/II-fold pyridoxal phosphate-dependent enzyme [Flavobacteriaceae bacterium]|nr:aminotransferase class I/II-fold pyridoxal phosphate-dependent enzyme [Flavobacteriaceae bacterium]